MEVQIADSDDKVLKCWPVIRELRPHLDESRFLYLAGKMKSEGVMMVFIETNGLAVAAAVFRMNYYLYRGRNVYIDDLITLREYRGTGYGRKILDWIKDYAIKNNCSNIHLDSGHHRFSAHRFYLNYDFKITSHHFALDL